MENNTIEPFRHRYSVEKRKKESVIIRSKYPDRIPIIVEMADSNSAQLNKLDRQKYLVPTQLTVGKLLYIIRTKIGLQSEQALFIFINNIMPPTNTDFESLYEKYKDDDGFLYVSYSAENTFGILK